MLLGVRCEVCLVVDVGGCAVRGVLVGGGGLCQGVLVGGCAVRVYLVVDVALVLGDGVSSGCSCVWFGEEGVVSDGSRLSRLCSAN